MDELAELSETVRDASEVVALTGAGISAPSGVPTFRGDDGVWERFDEGQFTFTRFRHDPAGFWADRLELQRAMYGEAYEPNPAHEALARLGEAGHVRAIVTQNTDGLHCQARDRFATVDDGASGASVLELHGNAHRVICTDCDRRADAEPVLERVADGERPPRCECGGVYKPDVVLFGERLPESLFQRARQLVGSCDVCLAVGTSLIVEPAASLPRIAVRNGATLAINTLDTTPLDDLATDVYRRDVVDVLPALEAQILGDRCT